MQWRDRLADTAKSVERWKERLEARTPGVFLPPVPRPEVWGFASAWKYLGRVLAAWPFAPMVAPPPSFLALKA